MIFTARYILFPIAALLIAIIAFSAALIIGMTVIHLVSNLLEYTAEVIMRVST